ncbi:MAG: SDR family oxidoreductase [Sneathiella sp.]
MSKDNRVILVTGATSGIGLASVRALKSSGFQVVLTGRNPDKVQACAAAEGVVGYTLNVADDENCASVIAQVEREVGPIWGLVNNAGIWLEGDFDGYDTADIRSVMETNTLGTMFMSHGVLPGMYSRGQGTILNVVSTGALYCRKSISVYSGSKWAIRGFTGCLEAECGAKGVRVMGYYPGKVSSAMYDTAGVPRDLEIAMTPDDAANMINTMITDEKNVWGQVSARSLNDYV